MDDIKKEKVKTKIPIVSSIESSSIVPPPVQQSTIPAVASEKFMNSDKKLFNSDEIPPRTKSTKSVSTKMSNGNTKSSRSSPKSHNSSNRPSMKSNGSNSKL